MKDEYVTIITIVLLLLIILSFYATGCQRVIIRKEPAEEVNPKTGETEYFVNIELNSFMMHFGFGGLKYKNILSLGEYTAESQEATVATPYGGIDTKKPE